MAKKLETPPKIQSRKRESKYQWGPRPTRLEPPPALRRGLAPPPQIPLFSSAPPHALVSGFVRRVSLSPPAAPGAGWGSPAGRFFLFLRELPRCLRFCFFSSRPEKAKKKQKAPVGAPPGPPRGGVRPPAAPTAAWPDGTATIETGSPRWGQTRNVGTPRWGDDTQSREGDRGSGTANSPLYRDRKHPSPGGHRSTSPGPAPPASAGVTWAPVTDIAAGPAPRTPHRPEARGGGGGAYASRSTAPRPSSP